MNLIKNKWLRLLLFSFGLFCLFLGTIGIFIPLLPTTPFILIAAWSFLRSSPKAHHWVLNHPTFGPALTQWTEKGIISRRSKLLAFITISASLIIIWNQSLSFELCTVLTIILASVLTFIISRPSKEL